MVLATTTSHPIVVGQDPDRRGADILITIRSQPVVYTWFEYDPLSRRWERRVAAVTDYVRLNSIRITARLTDESRRWIENELAQKYPGARVRRPFWNLRAQPTYRIVRNRVLPDGTNEVRIAISRIPFEDPGRYVVKVQARTRGTSWPGSSVGDSRRVVPPALRGTGPRTGMTTGAVVVYLLETTIVR